MIDFPYDNSDQPADNTWRWVGSAEGRRILITVNGGHWAGIGKHTIDPDGTVHPSVRVMWGDKEVFHDFIKLLDYPEGVKG